MNTFFKYFIFSIIFLWGITTQAYNLRQINSKDGLSNSAILSLEQDDDGVLWIGTCDGPNTYNGLEVVPFRNEYKDVDFSGNLIENVVSCNDNRLWMRTNYGLLTLDRKTKEGTRFRKYDGEFFLQKNSHNDIILVRVNNKVIYYSRKNDCFYEFPLQGIQFPDIKHIKVTTDDNLNIITGDGILRTYKIQYNSENVPSFASHSYINLNKKIRSCFSEKNADDVVYFVDNENVLYEYDLLTGRCDYILNIENPINALGNISSIVKFHNDYFIGFSTAGLIHLKHSPDQFIRYEVKRINIRSGIFCMLKDRNQDLIWIGTDGQGVFMYTEDIYTLKSYKYSDFVPHFSKPIRSIFLDKESDLWIGTKGDGIIQVKNYDINQEIEQNEKIILTETNSGLTSNSVYALAPSKRNLIWIGTEEGLCYYSYSQKKINRLAVTAGGVEIKHVHAILEDNDSILWLTSVGMGVVKVILSEGNDHVRIQATERFTPHNQSFATNHFFSAYKEDDNTIWFANRGHGAYRYDQKTGKFKQFLFDKNNKIPTLNDLFSISKSNDGNLWFGTGGGLVKMSVNDSNIVVYNEKERLPNSTIHGILLDSRNSLWLSTNQGVVSFNPEQDAFQIYNQKNGVEVSEFSDGASYKDTISGQLFFGGIDGFITISETENMRTDFFPKVRFDDLIIFGKQENIYDNISETKEGLLLELKHNQNFFSLSFNAIDFVEGTNYSYLYKLEGLSDRWIDNKTVSEASFTSIPPGDYILKVKYVNQVTGKESPEYHLIIKISPPWYKSTIAYIIYSMIILLSIFGAITYAILLNRRKKERMLRRLEKIHKEEIHESKIRFFTNIAHEFCTPLTLIYGPCSRILSHKGSDAFVTKHTTLIQRNAERLNSLIQELIEFRRIETDNRTPYLEKVNITDLVMQFSRNFEDMADSKNVNFSRSVQPSLEWVSDKSFLATIVTNLLSYVFRHIADEADIRLVVNADNDFLSIIISNTGEGIQDIKLVFDRYNILEDFEKQESTSSSRNGLGLAIVAGMVKLLNGTIKVKSEPNVNTEFIVQLPILGLETVENQNNIKYLPEPIVKQEYEAIAELPNYTYNANYPTLLIIDSDIEILWLIADIFRDEFNIKTSQEKVTMDDILIKYSPDIIICDVTLGDMNGIRFTKILKENKKTAHIPIVLISAKQAMEEQIEGISAGAEMYITKPFNVEYLKISVNHLINRKAVLQDYFSSPLSAFDLIGGKLTHHEDKKFVQKILDIINQNISSSKLSTSFIASEMNMSTRHLYRKLEDIGLQNQSPADMIRESRIHIAKNLLQNTTLTIDEIIYKSGFTNRATFFRLFSAKCNCTPKEYREKSLKDIESKI